MIHYKQQKAEKQMKNNNKFTFFILIALSIFLLSCKSSQSAAEKADKAILLNKQIENFDFKFNANHAQPLSYRSISLTSSYYVTVTSDTVKSYLPYFGRAYRAPMISSEGGIMFESTNFEHKVKKGKKDGEWFVTIKTKDTSRPFTLNFHLWDNAAAHLHVSHQDRQSISFQGYIEEKEKE